MSKVPLPLMSRKEASSGNVGAQMQQLALYILLLAFFILLNSLSTFKDTKVGAVLKSVQYAFSSGDEVDGPSGDIDRAGLMAKAIGDLRRLGEQIPGLLPLAKVEGNGSGDFVVVRVPESDLLTGPDGSLMREDRIAALNRIASVLSNRTRGIGIDVEILLSQSSVNGVAKAGTLARSLQHYGAPSAALGIGLEPRNGSEVRMLFNVRDHTPIRLTSEPTP